MEKAPEFNSINLRFNGFNLADAPALAAILDEPEVTKNITADASSPELSLASARKRIGWHNAPWATKGYGVWAVRPGDAKKAPGNSLLGWCGFAEPDIGLDPEILYGFTPKVWGQGLATEAARAAIDWLFSNTKEAGVSAIIFRRLNRASVHIVQKLGMTHRGTMALSDFYSSEELANEVLRYEMWRLSDGRSRDADTLLFEAPYRVGQLTTLGLGEPEEIKSALFKSARSREDFAKIENQALKDHISNAFKQGFSEPHLDWYHLPRSAWSK